MPEVIRQMVAQETNKPYVPPNIVTTVKDAANIQQKERGPQNVYSSGDHNLENDL
ncbi:9569_t:CDS:2 [Dentiscutata erythropus]|uniref:9569_t:CDS:1 n=1 Tax=Dentiscutata erythropus TaxID=1348616 RepID=A0A9N9NZA7_9GLOM|nr:9569_t:CDS:2 [Dentiscutata erythropus]